MSGAYHVFVRLSQLQYLAKTKCDFGISCLNCCIAVDFEVKENIQWSCTTDYVIFNILIFWCIIYIYIYIYLLYTEYIWKLPPCSHHSHGTFLQMPCARNRPVCRWTLCSDENARFHPSEMSQFWDCPSQTAISPIVMTYYMVIIYGIWYMII